MAALLPWRQTIHAPRRRRPRVPAERAPRSNRRRRPRPRGQTDPGGEACAYEAEPTPELDQVKSRLEAAGYRVTYTGYAGLGYFTDESEAEEFCADSAISIRGNGLDDIRDVLVRQYDDPARFEQGVNDLADTELITAEEPPLFYSCGGNKQDVLDDVVAIADGERE